MWNSFSTDAQLGITTEITTFSGGGGDTFHAYVARPKGDGPFPGVVVVHHLPGWDEFYLEFCERLARHGYLVICPDLYCRAGHGTPDDVAAKVRAEGLVNDDSIVADCAAALEWVKAQPDSTGRVGIIGSCSGGRHTVLIASRVKGFDAAVDLWGGSVAVSPEPMRKIWPVPPIEYCADLSAPLLGLFGNDDQSPPPDQVDLHEEELKKHGKEYEFHRYDGAGHGFFYYHTPLYRSQQAMDGWSKVFDFFGRKLGAQA